MIWQTLLDSVLARNGSDPHRGTDFARSCSVVSVNTLVSARYAWYKPGLVMMRTSHGSFPEPEVPGYRSVDQSVLVHPVSISGYKRDLVMELSFVPHLGPDFPRYWCPARYMNRLVSIATPDHKPDLVKT